MSKALLLIRVLVSVIWLGLEFKDLHQVQDTRVNTEYLRKTLRLLRDAEPYATRWKKSTVIIASRCYQTILFILWCFRIVDFFIMIKWNSKSYQRLECYRPSCRCWLVFWCYSCCLSLLLLDSWLWSTLRIWTLVNSSRRFGDRLHAC